MPTFEDRLLAELTQVVAERRDDTPAPAQRARRPVRRYAFALGAVAVAAAAAVIALPGLTGDNASEANASVPVTKLSDGSIKVRMKEFSSPEVLEAKLARYGIRSTIDFLPYGWHCRGRGENSDFWMEVTGPAHQRHDKVFGGGPGLHIHPRYLHKDEQIVLDVWYENADHPAKGAYDMSPMVKKAGSVPACLRLSGGPQAGG